MTLERKELLAELARLNDQLLQRGGAPSYDVEAANEFMNDAELGQAVKQTMREVRAIKEWS